MTSIVFALPWGCGAETRDLMNRVISVILRSVEFSNGRSGYSHHICANRHDRVYSRIGGEEKFSCLPTRVSAAADEAYATANADPALKAAATAVIGTNDEDGVAKWLEERFSTEEAHT